MEEDAVHTRTQWWGQPCNSRNTMEEKSAARKCKEGSDADLRGMGEGCCGGRCQGQRPQAAACGELGNREVRVHLAEERAQGGHIVERVGGWEA